MHISSEIWQYHYWIVLLQYPRNTWVFQDLWSENDDKDVALRGRCQGCRFLWEQCHQHTLLSRYIQHWSDDKKLNDPLHCETCQIVEQHYWIFQTRPEETALGHIKICEDDKPIQKTPPEQQNPEVAPYKFLHSNRHWGMHFWHQVGEEAIGEEQPWQWISEQMPSWPLEKKYHHNPNQRSVCNLWQQGELWDGQQCHQGQLW